MIFGVITFNYFYGSRLKKPDKPLPINTQTETKLSLLSQVTIPLATPVNQSDFQTIPALIVERQFPDDNRVLTEQYAPADPDPGNGLPTVSNSEIYNAKVQTRREYLCKRTVDQINSEFGFGSTV